MPWFRSLPSTHTPLPADASELAPLVTDLWQPGHFYVGRGLKLAWQFEADQQAPWETFRGNLVDIRQTRGARQFLAWNLLRVVGREARPEDPLLSILLDAGERTIHITRGLLVQTWEANSESNIIEGTESARWIRELVGSVRLDDLTSHEELRDELICRIQQAIWGTSRLPLTSVEAPLPAYSLGQLAYAYRADLPGELRSRPMLRWRVLLALGWSPELAPVEESKLLEVLLRAVDHDEADSLADEFVEQWADLGFAPRDLLLCLRRMFEEVSLSPYTEFVDRTLAFIEGLVGRHWLEAADALDFVAWLLRRICRHLTAYDLVTFHYRGANYPDALLLDAALGSLLRHAERDSGLFHGDGRQAALRRRALRQGLIVRRSYEGHLVPDSPTSPGDASRILPEQLPAPPKEQIDHPLRRNKQLFASTPTRHLVIAAAKEIFQDALRDLSDQRELAELGTALFIDRPFGWGKETAEPDTTPIVAHEAFSAMTAERRFDLLLKLVAECGLALADESAKRQRLRVAGSSGISAAEIAEPRRPVVSLADVRRVASDFVVVRSMPGSIERVFELLDSDSQQKLGDSSTWCWLFRSVGGDLKLIASDGRTALLDPDVSRGFVQRGRVEWPRGGVRVSINTDGQG
ncbi:MAG: hypothetical protein K2X38_19140 [Gemmataceae bacterium]|nr:hypothetical protein [Gemmataceae bacterium]